MFTIVTGHRSSWRIANLTMVVLLAVAPLSIAEQDSKPTDKETQVSLRLSIAIDEPGTTLAFTLTNNGTQDVLTTPVGTIDNFIVVTYPDGKIKELGQPVDHLDVMTLKPSESVTWKQDMGRRIGRYKLLEPGLYQLKWKWRKFTPRLSDPQGQFYISNEVLLLREAQNKKESPDKGEE